MWPFNGNYNQLHRVLLPNRCIGTNSSLAGENIFGVSAKELSMSRIRAGKREYFIDLKQTKNSENADVSNSLFIKITERNIEYKRRSNILFGLEDIRGAIQCLKEGSVRENLACFPEPYTTLSSKLFENKKYKFFTRENNIGQYMSIKESYEEGDRTGELFISCEYVQTVINELEKNLATGESSSSSNAGESSSSLNENNRGWSPNELWSSRIAAGRREYFIDLKESTSSGNADLSNCLCIKLSERNVTSQRKNIILFGLHDIPGLIECLKQGFNPESAGKGSEPYTTIYSKLFDLTKYQFFVRENDFGRFIVLGELGNRRSKSNWEVFISFEYVQSVTNELEKALVAGKSYDKIPNSLA